MQLSPLVAALVSASFALADSTFTPARPPAIPLAVKSPYLSTWLFAGKDDGNGGYLAGRWAQHWSGGSCTPAVNPFAGIVRVDGSAYEFMGFPSQRTSGLQPVNQSAFEYTATSSIFTQSAGPVQIKTTFLSPIYPNDQMRASLISSYVHMDVSSTDGQEHTVELYTDVSAEWATGDPNATVTWEYGAAGKNVYHKIARETQQLWTESPKDNCPNLDKAEWGTWYWAGEAADGQTYQSGGDTDVRGQFIRDGKLSNSNDTDFRSTAERFPVTGLAYDLGKVGSSAISKLFTINLYQESAIQFLGTGPDPVDVPSLWTAYFQAEEDALTFFFNDYNDATAMSKQWDDKIQTDSKNAGGDDYATITTLATRQAFAGVELVGNATKQYVFLKEISSDGNVDTVDVVYPSMPIFLYTNATWVKLMLDPLFENQEAGHYPNKYSMHDLGGSYPNATGHTDGKDEFMPVEESANMLIMTYAYFLKSNDINYLKQHYTILKQWTSFLVDSTLNQENQFTTDDFAGQLTNSTNLAYKGVVGIAAMGQIANLTGNADDARKFGGIASDYADQLNTLAFDAGMTHATLQFGSARNDDTWLSLYNLYADRLLGTAVIPQKVFDVQNTVYRTKLAAYGLPLDSRSNGIKSDWMMWVAAAAPPDVRQPLIAALARFVNETPTQRPFADLYDASTSDWPVGGLPMFYARPVQGGTFALLALADHGAAGGGSSSASGDGKSADKTSSAGTLNVEVAKHLACTLILLYILV